MPPEAVKTPKLRLKKKISRMFAAKGKSLEDEKDLSSREAMAAWHRKNTDVHDFYDVIEVVGHGHMGEISVVSRKEKAWENPARRISSSLHEQLAVSLHDLALPVEDEPLRCYACKTVKTARLKTADLDEILNEISIMRKLDHPNIIQLFEVYSTKRQMWLITELCYGGDLCSRDLDEPGVVVVLEQILKAVTYMHGVGVCHSDLKLENILYETPEADSAVKLIDFGLSQKFSAGTKMKRVCGTAYTLSPELVECDLKINKIGYTEKSDVWAIGCIVFLLLSGDEPFLGHIKDINNEEKLSKLLSGKYEFGPRWYIRSISDDAKEFIRGTLQKDPNTRWSAAEAFKFVHDTWIPGLEPKCPDVFNKKRVKMQSSLFRGMQKYAAFGLMKKTALIAMARTMDKSMLGDLKDLFLALDADNSGTITLDSLKETCLTYFEGRDFATHENIEEIFRALDTRRAGEINYTEFLAAVAESKGLINLERMQEAFDRIDSKGKGYITKKDLKAFFGKDAEEPAIKMMIEEATSKNNGKIDYNEFLRLMFEDPIKGLELSSGVKGIMAADEPFMMALTT